MAEEATTAEQSGLNFSEEDLSALEEEFAAPEETEDEPEDETEEGETEGDEEEEEGEDEEEAEEEDTDLPGEDAVGGDGKSAEKAEKPEEKEEETKGYELLVDGQPVLVDTEEELAAWAQKGMHYEKKDAARQKVVEDATFTMNALINDPMASLEEIWTSKYGGNHEQARQHVAKLAEGYLEPIWRELTAEPAKRLQIQQDRFNKRLQQTEQQQQTQAQNQFSPEDIQFIQTMDVQIADALTAVDLPKENTTLRKWMADVMRDGIDRGISPDPRAAAEFIKSQQQERNNALGNSAPTKDRKKLKGKAAKIAKAKARRSSRQRGEGAPQGNKGQQPQFMTSREWMDGLNTDLSLEP